MDSETRPGYKQIGYTVRIRSDASEDVLEETMEAAEASSPMFDNVRNGVSISELDVVN